ncbi:MAG: flagellar assembly protein T N-terminal domain-containing protein [Methyloprofundus sp.]|nr:flagellar assembly protein T N-terminal domain-containing protein [Methyloprofundus sp.]
MQNANKHLLLIFCLLLQACSISKTPASLPVEQIATVEGQAIIQDGAQLLARKMAIRDAIRQASLENNSQINSRTLINQNSIALDAFSLRTTALINNTKVIDEWIENDTYHVRAIVHLTTGGMCTPQYRKRIAATAFPMVQPSQISMAESNDLSNGIPREISNILTESGAYLGRNKTHTVLYADPDLAPEITGTHPYDISDDMTLAKRSRVQFVLSGVIRDLESSPRQYNRGSGVISWIKSLNSYFYTTRSITIDAYIHDGYSGALLFQHRYKDQATGSIRIPKDVMVGSEQFNDTDTGNKITKIINQSVKDIQQALNCYPFYTRILKIEDNKVFIDAGAQERLNEGDQLVVYSSLGTINQLGGEQEVLGFDKKPAGVLTIKTIMPLFAIGELEAPPHMLGIKVGDWVKSW